MSKNKNDCELVIKPKRRFIPDVGFKELYQYRELLYFLSWKEIKVRYKQTALGASWAVLQPFLTMIIFTIVFGRLAKMPSEGIPYPIFSYSGLLLWTYFANSISTAGNSLVANQNLVSKIYFPRLLIPTSCTVSGLLDYAIAMSILVIMMVYYNFCPNISIILLPYIILMTFILANGLGYLFSAINVKYRDMRYALPFFIQLLLFLTPVIYPTDIGGAKYSWIFLLNPMTGFINAHRTCILGHANLDVTGLLISSVLTVAIFIIGIIYFKKTESYFADII
jgi:lipopolysaccharide transport system permease protein